MQQDTDSTKQQDLEFYKDVRFWLIIAMLAAFLAFIFVKYPA